MGRTLLALAAAATFFVSACSSETESVPTVGSVEETVEVTESPIETSDEVTVEDDVIMEDMDDMSEPMEMPNAPDDWPADLPIPANGTLQAWTQPFENQIMATWLIADGNLMDDASAYDQALTALDFADIEYVSEESSASGRYANADREVTFEARPVDGGVEISVDYTSLDDQ